MTEREPASIQRPQQWRTKTSPMSNVNPPITIPCLSLINLVHLIHRRYKAEHISRGRYKAEYKACSTASPRRSTWETARSCCRARIVEPKNPWASTKRRKSSRRGRVERPTAAADPDGAAHSHGHHRHPLLPAHHWDRGHRPLQPLDLQEGRPCDQEPAVPRHYRRRHRQDCVHLARYPARRQGWEEKAIPLEHNRDDIVAHRLSVILTMIEHSQLAINRMMNSATSMSFVWLYKAITIGGAFFLFSDVGVIAWVFYFLCCPEMRGRVLEEEMEEVFLKPQDKKLRNNEGGV
ncbi:hypothetical protein Cni_G10338 [Canna indica]|uniref:Uncharacterized protein n=1 Tax=Canna indica TaxID=4628 RepID=A0AAQ3Q9S9_9LILI|nr:hypothetical protein Cni_G10338 [Canna indica]